MPEAPAAAAPAAPSSPSSAPSAPASAPSSAPAAAPTGASPTASAAAATLPHQGGDVAAPKPDAPLGETKAEAAQRMRLKTKVNGKETERDYTSEELQLYVQKGMGADEKFQAAANVQKTFQSFIEAVKSNPFEAFKDPAFGDLGAGFKDLVIAQLAKEFEAEDLKKANPQQYELQQYKARVAEFEAREAAQKESAQQAAQQESDRRMWAETEKSWTAALDKSGLGGNKAYVRQLAEIGRDFLDAGLDLSPDLLVAELKTRLADQQRSFLGGAKGEALVNLLGKDAVNEILTYHVGLATKARPAQEPIKPPEPQKPEEKDTFEPPSRSLRSYADFLRQK